MQETILKIQTVDADLRQREHIPKMQNDIGPKSTLRVLRQPRSKDLRSIKFWQRQKHHEGSNLHPSGLQSVTLPTTHLLYENNWQ